jgi:beta-1,4-mannosyltransferase
MGLRVSLITGSNLEGTDDRGHRAILHDRPPNHFSRTGAIHQADLCRRLIPDLCPELPETFLPSHLSDPETPFTISRAGMPELRPERPALLLSSTSWTADEDFSLLLTGLDKYQEAINSGKKLPELLVIITGKGALRKPFEKAVAEREKSAWTDVCVRCHFLHARDYPTLLGCADLGVSLHTSSSGRDLPMKVVDMFGCGVPVLAKGFGCIDELVKHGENGLVFNTGEELGDQIIACPAHLTRAKADIQDTLAGFPKSAKLDKLHSYFAEQTKRNDASYPARRSDYRRTEELDDEWTTWDDNWDRVVYRGILNPGSLR